MVKKELISAILLVAIHVFQFTEVCAYEDTGAAGGEERTAKGAQLKAEEIHNIASSDAIYVTEELKALYYQNLQIIELLKQIRNLLLQQLESAK